MNFCETLPSMLKLMNDLLRRFLRTPKTRLRQPLKGTPSTSYQSAGRSAGLLGRLHLSGWDPTKIRMGACVEWIHRMRRVEAKKMRSVRAPTSHLPDVMVVDPGR